MRALAKRTFLRACRAAGLFALCRRRYRRRLLILCYHGFELADEARFWPSMFMRPDTFERRLQLLARSGRHVLGLEEAVKRLAAGTLPEHAVVITVDDGFYSTLAGALPALQRHEAPATLYVTSYYADNGLPVFNLAVPYLLWKRQVDRLPAGSVEGLPEQEVDLTDPAARARLQRQIVDHGNAHRDAAGRERLAERLGEALGVEYAALRRQRLLSLLDREEIAQLARAGVDIQLHTHRHSFPLDEAAAEREITENRRFLESITGRPCEHFCYPSGIYKPTQWRGLERLGIKSATTCEHGFNHPETPPLALRRFLDSENVSEIEFLAELSGFQDLLRTLRRRLKNLLPGRSQSARPADAG